MNITPSPSPAQQQRVILAALAFALHCRRSGDIPDDSGLPAADEIQRVHDMWAGAPEPDHQITIREGVVSNAFSNHPFTRHSVLTIVDFDVEGCDLPLAKACNLDDGDRKDCLLGWVDFVEPRYEVHR